MKAWGAVLVAFVLAAVPASAFAKPGYFVSGPGRRAVFTVPGSNGYEIRVETRRGQRNRMNQVYVSARKGHASVQYGVRGQLTSDDSIDVRLPHVGRIAVRFVPNHVNRRRVPDNCKGRPSRVEHGYFRGNIRLRGEREFTRVERSSAPGRVVQSFRRVCDNGGGAFFESGEPKGSNSRSSTILFTGNEESRNTVSFMASEFELGPTVIGPSFSAQTARFREGMTVFYGVDVDGETGDLIAPQPGAPKLAEVKPPSPFEGTAIFRLTGPKTSTFEGDLAVELPGLGKVPLAGAEFWSAYCQDTHCTNTAPSNVSFSSIN